MIAIIDYGMGNLRSVQKGFEKVGHAAEISSDPRVLAAADRIVLPGRIAWCLSMDMNTSIGMKIARSSGVPVTAIRATTRQIASPC